MKKLVLAVAALGLISLTSCKKDYTCSCTGGTIPYEYKYTKVKKADAKTACETQNTAYKAIGAGSCALK
ncbi:MAG: hypothetical protein WC716_00980 [Chitinophagaceae bacterium]